MPSNHEINSTVLLGISTNFLAESENLPQFQGILPSKREISFDKKEKAKGILISQNKISWKGKSSHFLSKKLAEIPSIKVEYIS